MQGDGGGKHGASQDAIGWLACVSVRDGSVASHGLAAHGAGPWDAQGMLKRLPAWDETAGR